jgi:RHS repeat-associated protein
MKSPRRFLLFLFSFASLSQVNADVGNNNPSGVSGIFNGNVTTGCSYDPYTGNAHRTITDMVVAGGVGEYPLALTRTSNSRSAWGNAFGVPGAWRHNYQWTIQVRARGISAQDIHYTVHFPDGRTETFDYSTLDPYYQAAPGVRHRLKPWTSTNGTTGVCYLILTDGGKVEFTGTRTLMHDPELIPPDWYEFDLVATAIIDPYGLRTALAYDANGRLSRVTEPAGRYFQFTYRTTTGQTHMIDKLTGSDGRTVDYNYTNISPGGQVYSALTSVVYYGDATWTARYTYQAPNVPPTNGLPLLRTADDPMYSGPMKRIGYVYKSGNNPDGSAAVYGQILSENYYDGTTIHAPGVSTLEITTATTRKETRSDNETRTFTYSATGYLTSLTDFKGINASQTYDANKYINSVTDRNGNRTDFSSNALNGNLTVTTFPLTQGDTPGQTQRPTVQYTYGSPSCADPNNQDADNPSYVCTAKDEGGNVTQFLRNPNKRITRINYPDGGYETFTYNSFGQVLAHRMTTGGTESFTYDARGLKQTYRNPSNATGNPTARYQYDTRDHVSGVTDVLGTSLGDPNHSTSFTYNLRGQVTVTTLPKDPVDNLRHTIVNTYNADGTLASKRNELNQATSYTYDDYRRVTSVTTPARYAGDSANHTTEFSYYVNGMGDDYKYTDSNVAWIHLPGGKWINTVYDDNRRKTDVTVGWGTVDAATTSYGYDNVGNATSVTNPLNRTTTTAYDERNRPSSVTRLTHTTRFKYDLAGRKQSVIRPNGQVITYVSYDAMNRLLQQNVSQTPEPVAVTKYTYTPAGLLATMQDPRLVALNSTYKYTYAYDTMGRKTSVTYPPASAGQGTTETFTYDTSGRLRTFINRNSKTQTFTYDALNRMTGFSWNDGVTPSVSFGYDIGSRLTSINNANAAISRLYWADNLLRAETETITGGVARQVIYTYDADGNRDTLAWTGSGTTFSYTYTGRNQLKDIRSGATTLATYGYDLDGNVSSRTLNNSTHTDYAYDAFDRVTWVVHDLNGRGRTFTYGYEPDSNNRKWAKRLITPASPEGNKGEVFDYDLADQVTAVKLNVPNPDTTAAGAPTITYDANGNRNWYAPYYPAEQYSINNLSQYSSRTIHYTGGEQTTNAAYDTKGNLTITPDDAANRSTYAYDAQNRLTQATKSGVTTTFFYDGLNRQVKRTLGGTTTYSVWDGWDLVQEYQGGGAVTANYLYGATGLVKNLVTNNYYYQDGSGSTSHLANSNGALLEWYRYDLQGTPVFYNAADVQITGSNHGVRHLFTGQQWYSELGLYDLRNRFYSPDIGRFLQPDPIGFAGDPTNLYRYCGNNPVTRSDPMGANWITLKTEAIWSGGTVYVFGNGFPPALEHPPGGVSSLGNSPHSGRADGVGSAGDGGGGGGFDITYGVRPTPLLSVPPIASSPLPPSPPLIPNPNDPYYPIIPVNPYNGQPLIFPSTVDPRALIAAAQLARWNAVAVVGVIYVLSPNGPLDKQLKLSNPLYQNAGNWLLGAEGRAMGFSTDVLLRVGGYFNAGVGTGAYGDYIEDSFMIELGADYSDGL